MEQARVSQEVSLMCLFGDKKTEYGILIGFFLASALLFGSIQVAMGPLYSQLVSMKGYAQTTYDITHSPAYAKVQAFVANVDQSAEELATMPFIGGAVEKSEVPAYARAVSDILQGRKNLSEIELWAINTEIMLIQISLPLMLLSLAIAAYGVWKVQELMDAVSPAPAARAQKPKKGKKR